MKWIEIWNRLWRLVDMPGDCYFSGGRFLDTVREVSLDVPSYSEVIALRNQAKKSTSRRDYFRDIFMELSDGQKVRLVNRILAQVHHCDEVTVEEIRTLLSGATVGPTGSIPAELWNADRLNHMLNDIDDAITAIQYERAVALGYTCLEGFYGAFFRAKSQEQAPHEIIELSKWVRSYLRSSMPEYPDEILNLISQTTHAIDKSRNRFSEAHFAGEAGLWLAVFVRDLVNSQVRLLLHFM
jgi:hypothetical protein